MPIYVDSRNNVGDVTAGALTADSLNVAGAITSDEVSANSIETASLAIPSIGLVLDENGFVIDEGTIGGLTNTNLTSTTATIQTLNTVAFSTQRAVDASDKCRVRTHVAELTTTGNTPTAILTVPAVASSVMDFEVLVVAVKSTDDAHWKRTAMASFRVSSLAAATELGTTDQGTIKSNGTVTSMAVTVTVSGTNLNVLVTGRTAETWRWGAKVTVTTRTIAA
jgi:hypothetical protein